MRSWARAWETASPADFAAQYAEDGMYVVHAFRFARSGRDALEEHRHLAQGDLELHDGAPRDPLARGRRVHDVRLQGTFTGDLPRMKATGEDVVFHGRWA